MSSLSNAQDVEKDINKACHLTQHIIDLIEESKIENVEVLNQERLALIDAIFSGDKSLINRDSAKTLFEINSEAINVMKRVMEDNKQKQQKIRKGNQVHNAYMQNQR